MFVIRSLEVGGAEQQLVSLALGLKRLGHDVSVVVLYPNGYFTERLKIEKINVVCLEKSNRWANVRCFFRLVRQVRSIRPQVIHSYLDSANIYSVMVKPFTVGRVPIIWGIRSSGKKSGLNWFSRAALTAQTFLSRFADLIIVNSTAGERSLIKLGYSPRKVVVIPNGIDTVTFKQNELLRKQGRDELGIKQHEFLIGIVGRLVPVKAHPVFLQAANLMSNVRNDVRFICIGGGPQDYSTYLRRLADELGLHGKVIWAGERSNMAMLYNSMDIITSCSETEGFSNAIAEAMACNVPCVVTNVGDSAALVGEYGMVVPINSPREVMLGWGNILGGTMAAHPPRSRITANYSLESLINRTEAIVISLLEER